MSLFTVDAKYHAVCLRCKSGEAAVLVKRAGDFDIYDCRSCGVISPVRAAQAPTPRRARR